MVDGPRTCADCHWVASDQGLFGTSATATFEGNSQIFKVTHLRTIYQKVGMFGLLSRRGGGVADQGDQVRGFGYAHDSSVDTIFRFVSGRVFNFPDDTSRREVEQYLLAFNTDLAPIVGQQVTLDAERFETASERVALLTARAATPFQSKVLGGQTTNAKPTTELEA